ncbi:hypothetical protein N9B94_04410 [Verrucomicrobia bacterium]|nr:hypothetical protein [Verrucomicrobiota bacterium]
MAPDKILLRRMMLALVVVIAIVYWRAPFSEFLNYDDNIYVTNNLHVANGLTFEGIIWSFTSTEYSAWTPVTWLSLALDGSIYGLQPGGFHLTNLLLHAANAALLLLLIHALTRSPSSAFFVALIWCIHPLNVEPVMWISERKGLLSSFFGLLALLQWTRYKQFDDKTAFRRTHWLLALSLLAKPMLITLPALLILLDHWPFQQLNRQSLKRLIMEKRGILTLCVIAAGMAYYSQNASGAVKPSAMFPADQQITTAIGGYFNYFAKTCIPLPISQYSIFYPIPITPDFSRSIAGLAVLQGLLIVCYKCRTSKPAITVGLLWFLCMLIPVIATVKIGIQGPADRYMYFPMIGILIAAWHTFSPLISKWKHPQFWYAGGLTMVVLAQAATTISYTPMWQKSVTLFSHTLAHTRETPLTLNQLGLAYSREGDKATALPFFQRAIDYRELGIALADGLSEQGNTKRAIRRYLDVLRFQPDFARAHNNVAIAYAKEGQSRRAEYHWAEAINHGSAYLEAYENLANSFRQQGFIQQSDTVIQKAIAAAEASGKTNAIARLNTLLSQQ